MERLSRHILSLLRLYDSVALPGFGFLFLKNFPSRFDEESLSLYPPVTDLLFRPSSPVSSDQLLASYAGTDGYSKEEAEGSLRADLKSLETELKTLGSVSLPGVGTFVGGGDLFYFVSAYHTDAVLPVLMPTSAAPAYEFEIDDDPFIDDMTHELLPYEEVCVADNSEDFSSEECPVEDRERRVSYRNPDYYYIPIHKTMAKIAACIALVVVVGLVALLPFSPSRKSSSTASIVPIAVSGDTAAAKNTEGPASRKSSATPDSTSTDRLKVAPLNFKEEEDRPAFYAVVAAFKSEAQVQKFISTNKRNEKAFKVISNGNYHLITVASASSREDLDESLPLIRSEYPDAWVYSPQQ